MLQNNQILHNTADQANLIIKHLEQNPNVIPVWDLDGVLLNASHRIKLHADGSLDLDQYRLDSTRDNVLKDRCLPLMGVISHLNTIGRVYHVATARVLCAYSKELLEQRSIKPAKIISRQGEGDSRKDWILKVQGVQEQFDPKDFNKIMLIDDCPSNCDAFVNALGAWAINVKTDYNSLNNKWLQQLL